VLDLTDESGLICGKILADRVIVPRSPLAALPEEVEMVIVYVGDHPREGYLRLAWMLVDEDVVYLTLSLVYRILDQHNHTGIYI